MWGAYLGPKSILICVNKGNVIYLLILFQTLKSLVGLEC